MTESQSLPDPLSWLLPLPIVRTFYPMGFALELSTNSAEIAAMADSLWSRYPKLSDSPPVRLRIAVSEDVARSPAVPSLPRGQGHLFSIVHGPDNFAVADLAGGFAFACLSRDVAADSAYAIHYFLEPVSYMLLAAERLTILHAACVSREGKGILLAGDSGAGKTCLSYACGLQGWKFVSGDACALVRESPVGRVVGRPFTIRFRESARSLFPELRRYDARRGMNGKDDIEPPLEELGISGATEAQVTHVVFLKRAQQRAEFAPLSSEDAYRRLDQFVLFGDAELQRRHRASLSGLLNARPALELIYGDVGDAELALRSLLVETCS
jgi:hypothetical protein